MRHFLYNLYILFLSVGICSSLIFTAPKALEAFTPDKLLSDSILEERAQDLHEKLRCLVCQGQSIAESNAELARDLRMIVREQLFKGYSESEITNYLTERYGDFILMDPPIKVTTYALWFGPLLALVIGLFIVYRVLRGSRGVKSSSNTPDRVTLSENDKRKLKALLENRPK